MDTQNEVKDEHEKKQKQRNDDIEQSLLDTIADEKKRYPGASDWAEDEERLFEILFLREHLPLMPAHWVFDLSRVPLNPNLFGSSDKRPPVIYAHSSKEFSATTVLMRLIELTSQVRTDCQSGLRHKAPSRIRKGIDKFMRWASEDGGYVHLRYIPNITVATVDDSLDESGITLFMEQHMHALARLQREFFKDPQDADFWDGDGRERRQSKSPSKSPLLKKFLPPFALQNSPRSNEKRSPEDVSNETSAHDGTLIKAEDTGESKPHFKDLCKLADSEIVRHFCNETPTPIKREEPAACDVTLATLPQKEDVGPPASEDFENSPIEKEYNDEDIQDPKDGDFEPSEDDGDSDADDVSLEGNSCDVSPLPSQWERDCPVTPRTPRTPRNPRNPRTPRTPRWRREATDLEDDAEVTPKAIKYRRQPPVVYGLFILRTSVFLLTLDSAKGDSAMVSFQEDMHFANYRRSLWNGLTVAIAVCLARDELMSRLDDFDPIRVLRDSDPDA